MHSFGSYIFVVKKNENFELELYFISVFNKMQDADPKQLNKIKVCALMIKYKKAFE